MIVVVVVAAIFYSTSYRLKAKKKNNANKEVQKQWQEQEKIPHIKKLKGLQAKTGIIPTINYIFLLCSIHICVCLCMCLYGYV